MFMVKSVTLRRQYYYTAKPEDMGPMTGSIELINQQKTEVNLQITEEQTRRIMEVLADALVDTAKQTSSLLTTEIIEQVSDPKLLGKAL